MTARILVVDDEPDLEPLIRQRFRHQIRDGTISFLFARDGGLTLLQKLQENEQKLSTVSSRLMAT
jgi:adenylate cyclase